MKTTTQEMMQAAIEKHNQEKRGIIQEDFEALEKSLKRKGLDLHEVLAKVKNFTLALPSWGVGTGGTRFARFPMGGEPRHIFDKLEDCAVIHQLTRSAPRVSTHFPWDRALDYPALKAYAEKLSLSFDAINSNTFQDQKNQKHSYQYGSLSHCDERVRRQAIEHNIECIEIGKKLGSHALTVWIADGSNFPGQVDFEKTFRWYLESMKEVVAHVPSDWTVFVEYKFFEPSFYSTVIADWGTSYLAAMELGEQTKCLVDLGHHAKSANVEMIVSRLAQFKKLGGFHFNDSQYGDDDLDSGIIHPFQLFLIFHELVKLEGNKYPPISYMIDQSHNVTDPISSLMMSIEEILQAYTKALLIRGDRLSEAQENNDAILAHGELKEAFYTDVRALIALSRMENNGAAHPLELYQKLGYRKEKTKERPAVYRSGGGLV